MSYAAETRQTELATTSSGQRWRGDYFFWGIFSLISSLYIGLLIGMVAAQWSYTWPGQIVEILSRSSIQSSLWLTLRSSCTATLLSLFVGIPVSYLMARCQFQGKGIVDGILDIPNVLPPLVLGLCLLLMFQYAPFQSVAGDVVYQVPAVFLAQFIVATAYAIPILRAVFEQIDPRTEQVAMTLGCTRFQAFMSVTMRDARYGILLAATMAWARCLGSFGPLLVFAGATRNKTEVLSTTIFLELSVGDVSAAVGVSVVLILLSCTVLSLVRTLCPLDNRIAK